jgi:hypothetical protein
MKTGEPLPKIGGSLHLEFKRCGQRRCRCQRGLLHGPYVYWHWRDGARQRKTYVPMRRLGNVLLALQESRAATPRPSEIRRMMKGPYHV